MQVADLADFVRDALVVAAPAAALCGRPDCGVAQVLPPHPSSAPALKTQRPYFMTPKDLRAELLSSQDPSIRDVSGRSGRCSSSFRTLS